jgi:hypothetical protein
MAESMSGLDARLRGEADDLFEKQGLAGLCAEYGKARLGGAYRLRTMAWRELEILLEAPNIVDDRFFALGGRLASLLAPERMLYRNTRVGAAEGEPRGLSWSIHLGDEAKGAWRILLWALPSWEVAREAGRLDDIRTRLTEAKRLHVIAIKARARRDPAYGDIYGDRKILEHVLDGDVTDYEGLMERLDILGAL